jgi:tetratricopeptide (TPR) repeat protein
MTSGTPHPSVLDIDAHFRRAFRLHQSGQVAQAAALYRDILAADPNHFDALHLLGVARVHNNDVKNGLDLIERALAVNNADPAAHYNRALALILMQRPEDAVSALDTALSLKPDYAVAHFLRGNALRQLARPHDALSSYDRALALDPNYVEASVNRAIQLKTLGRFEDALAELDRILFVAPQAAMVHVNRGSVLLRLGHITEALAAFEKTIASGAHLGEAHFGAAECRLTLGEWPAGFAEFEWRWKTAVMAPAQRVYPQPLWLGDAPLRGKTLLLHAEQGLGDTIQFARYALLALEQGARVVLEVQPKLKALIATISPDITVVARGEALPTFDMHAPLMSLPHAFKTTTATVPTAVPYLKADPARVNSWRTEFAKKPGRNIGLAWSGTPTHENDHNRSASLAAFAALHAPGLNFYGLQTTMSDADKIAAGQFPSFTHLGDPARDFADVAAMVQALDAVVTVDTVFAHLAGALAQPVSVLLSRAVDWRWLLERTDSPWYPAARLYRQERLGDWAQPLRQVRADLIKLAAS